MNPKQLDEFQAWLLSEATRAEKEAAAAFTLDTPAHGRADAYAAAADHLFGIRAGEPPLAASAGWEICWEPHPTDLGRLRGFLPAIPSVTLFLIDVCDDKPHRGTMRGAFIPDDEDGVDLNEHALVVTLKNRAEAYLRDWDEARAKQSPTAPASATEGKQ